MCDCLLYALGIKLVNIHLCAVVLHYVIILEPDHVNELELNVGVYHNL